MNVTTTVNGQTVPSKASPLPPIHPTSTLWSSASPLESAYRVQRTFDARRAAPARNGRRPTVLKRAAGRGRRFLRYSVAAVLLLSTGFSAPASSRDAISEDCSKRPVYPK